MLLSGASCTYASLNATSTKLFKLQGSVVQSPIKLILGLSKFLIAFLFTAKGGFATKFCSNKAINYKFLSLKP